MSPAMKVLERFSRWAAIAASVILVSVAVLDLILARVFFRGIASAPRILEHALLALAFFSALQATIKKTHLALNGGSAARTRTWQATLIDSVSIAVDLLLFCAALSLIFIGFEPGALFLGLPIGLFVSPMAIGFLLMALAGVLELKGWLRLWALPATAIGLFLAAPALLNLAYEAGLSLPFLETMADAAYAVAGAIKIPAILFLAVAAFFGLPLYVVLSGTAALLFLGSWSAIELIPSEAYNLLKNASMPAIPLFTIAGFLLSDSGAGKRLVAVFRELFGWMPGGEAFAAVLVCTFFTTFTGANGVTILALGGILAYILIESGAYPENYAHGLLTASSSVGLLFPPSIAIILYAVNAQFMVQGQGSFSITDMFLGSLIPGLLMVLAMGGAGLAQGLRFKASRKKFSGRAALKALWEAAPELFIPVLIVILYFSGFAGLTEIGAVTIVYLIVVEGILKREVGIKALISTLSSALPVAGGALIIIAAARGLSFYIIDAGVPELFANWLGAAIQARWAFLLLLNLGLLLVGCFMDVFSAVLVVSPLIIPLGFAYGVHPVHLGAIFITNLSIGFLTPPIGMNLFLASYAFNKPVMKIYKDVLPFFLIQLAVLFLITWVPWFSLALLPKAAM